MQPLPNISFVITKLTIFPGTSSTILKNLAVTTDPVEYCFTTDSDSSLYGNNITIQAIVGENGAGKTSLLDIIFRMVNNFGALLYRTTNDMRDHPLRYVCGIYADLEYYIYGKKAVLQCRDRAMALTYDKDIYLFGENAHSIFTKGKVSDNLSDREVNTIASHFFYTIVTNYSLQAYISDDYEGEACIRYQPSTKEWIGDRCSSWISSLFHKNDGYMCPINLNPFRDEGVIDMNNEIDLTRTRIASLLIYLDKLKEYENGINHEDATKDEITYQLLDGYTLARIDYSLNKKKLLKWFPTVKNENDETKYHRIIEEFKSVSRQKGSPSSIILNKFELSRFLSREDDLLWFAMSYLVVKVLSIAGKYPAYRKFRQVGNIAFALSMTTGDSPEILFRNLTKEIKGDKSHISLKINSTLGFIYNYDNIVKHVSLTDTFTFGDYEKGLKSKDGRRYSVKDIIRRMPPSFFQSKIILKKDDTDSEMPFSHLSSGERQFIFTVSTAIYHILNLRSIDESRPKYRGINVVFDEVELCFHPEYQRTFVINLLRLVKAVNIPSDCSLNIILVTHSPFILSDIPKDHVLYLKDGGVFHDNYASCLVNPFAANVCDILKNDFFLNNGFMGAFAQKKIGALVSFLSDFENERESYDMSLAKNMIARVGDPLLKSHLKRMLDQFCRKHPNAMRKPDEIRLEELRDEIARLEKKIADEKNID